MIADYPALLATADQGAAQARDLPDPTSVTSLRASVAAMAQALGDPWLARVWRLGGDEEGL